MRKWKDHFEGLMNEDNEKDRRLENVDYVWISEKLKRWFGVIST